MIDIKAVVNELTAYVELHRELYKAIDTLVEGNMTESLQYTSAECELNRVENEIGRLVAYLAVEQALGITPNVPIEIPAARLPKDSLRLRLNSVLHEIALEAVAYIEHE